MNAWRGKSLDSMTEQELSTLLELFNLMNAPTHWKNQVNAMLGKFRGVVNFEQTPSERRLFAEVGKLGKAVDRLESQMAQQCARTSRLIDRMAAVTDKELKDILEKYLTANKVYWKNPLHEYNAKDVEFAADLFSRAGTLVDGEPVVGRRFTARVKVPVKRKRTKNKARK